jgi:hypothetical protein
LRTWAGGLGERGGFLGRAVGAAQRLPVMSLPLTLSLGDERVVVARLTSTPSPVRESLKDRESVARA